MSSLTTKVVLEDEKLVQKVLEKQKKLRSPRIILLILAFVLLFFGTISGYAMLQLNSNKLANATTTAVEMSKLSLVGGCEKVGVGDERCVKARQVVENPEVAVMSGSPEPAPAVPQAKKEDKSGPVQLFF